MAFAQKSNGSLLSRNNKSFIIIIIYHLFFVKPFSSYIYGFAYLRVLFLFSQKVLSLIDINSLLLLIQNAFII